ncbi:MAG: T9SS type A sorting domain-containing protein [Lewinellaceae bacterium]|nr:T9SS type A sorting domain-containing protein [Lewinellaceae bacterium]MCB9289304.1 T9SS type A sorting domain-containing protein [Lewinellaceae bacterium]
MKTLFTLFLIAILSLTHLNAQESVLVSVGASYSHQSYYTLADNTKNIVANESWDLAFTTAPGTAGVFLNEAATASFTGEAPELRLYYAPVNNFSEEVDPMILGDSLYNAEIDWENGAFNSLKIEGGPDDYGWGTYDAGTQTIQGSQIFALKLRSGAWKKVFIESLANDIYTFKYADLNGANEKTFTINKADFAGSPFAYFSLDTELATASPAGWDLLFTRYRTALDPGTGEIVQYMVTGVLNGLGAEAAEARNVDPLTIDHEPYLDSLSTQLDIIGQDWKFFDLGSFSWIVDLNRAFFVKTAENRLWKIFFYDFGGSSTGNFTFEKTDLGLVSSVEAPASNFVDFGIFPNPVADEMTVSFSLKESRKNLQLSLCNSLGQPVWQSSVQGNEGLNVLNLRPGGELPSGIYHLTVGAGNDLITKKVMVR